MANTINADNGVSSGSAGLKETADSSGVLALQTNGTTALIVDTSQNVGIGTTSPGYKLQVVGSIAASTQILGPNGSAATPSISSTAETNAGLFFGDNGVSSYMGMSTGGTERMRIDPSGNVGIGTTSPSASAILDAQSTTKGVRMPNMTTTQKNAISSPAAGLMVFDTTLAKLCIYSGLAWQTVTSV